MDEKNSIFISYSRSDKTTALEIINSLQARGITVWFDGMINPGQNWRDAIVSNLEEARIMLILLSSRAVRSEELKKELAVAKASKVPLLAVRLEEIELGGAFAYELAGLNWFDLFIEPKQRITELTDFIQQLIQQPNSANISTQASIEQFGSGKQPELAWYKKIWYNNSQLFTLFLLNSALQFLCYEILMSPLTQLISSGLSPLTAYLYVTIAVTIASPLLLLAVLSQGLALNEIPLLCTALLNTALLLALVRNMGQKLYHKIKPYKNKP